MGETVQWQVQVQNTGNGIAPNISVTDVVQSGFTNVTATNGTASLGTTANVVGNTITWTPPFTLTPGQQLVGNCQRLM